MKAKIIFVVLTLLLASCEGKVTVENAEPEVVDTTPRFDTTNTQRLNKSWNAVMYELSDVDQQAVAMLVTEYFQLTSGGEDSPYHNPANNWTFLMHDEFRPIMLSQLYAKIKTHPQYADKDIHGMSFTDLSVLVDELKERRKLRKAELAKQQQANEARQLERLRTMLPEYNEKLVAALDEEKRNAAAFQVKIAKYDKVVADVASFKIESHDKARKTYKVTPTLRITNKSPYDLQSIGLDFYVDYGGIKKKITGFSINKSWHMGKDSLRPGDVIEPTLPTYRVTYGSHRVDAAKAAGFKLGVDVVGLVTTDRQHVTTHEYKSWVKALSDTRRSDRVRKEIAQIKSQITNLEEKLNQ
jgi:ribosomal protein L29